MGDKSNSVYYTIKRMTHKALQEIPDGFWAISSICEEDAGGEIYPIFVEQIPFTNERLHIWERIKELDLSGRLIHVFKELTDARVMFDYDYDYTDSGWRPEE